MDIRTGIPVLRPCDRAPDWVNQKDHVRRIEMASLMQRINMYLRSPKGRQIVDRGRRELAKPSTQDRLRRIVARLSGRR